MQRVNSADGTAIAFDLYGQGPPVILVGGAFQHRAIDPSTAQLADRLGQHFSVYHYDRRGRGDSGDTPPYAPEREIEDLEALIAAAGGSAYVFGMSSGAPIVLDAAARATTIKKMAVYEPPFIVDDSMPPAPADYVAHLKTLIAAGRRGDVVEYFLITAAGVPVEYIAPMRDSPIWPAFEKVAHTLAYDGAFMEGTISGKPLPPERWAAVTVPTLVMDGGNSDLRMHSAAQALADALPAAQRRTLEGQTHEVAPEVLAPLLEDFFGAGERPA